MGPKTKLWIKSLAAAIIGGAANAVAVVVVLPDKFSFADLPSLAKVAVAGMIIALVGFLKQSPLPPDNGGA